MFALGVVIFSALLTSACAKPSATGSLSFLVLGDWGGQPSSPYYTTAENDIAAAMGKTAQNVGSQFTISVGDNFYEYGVQDVADPRFGETFEVSYVALKGLRYICHPSQVPLRCVARIPARAERDLRAKT